VIVVADNVIRRTGVKDRERRALFADRIKFVGKRPTLAGPFHSLESIADRFGHRLSLRLAGQTRQLSCERLGLCTSDVERQEIPHNYTTYYTVSFDGRDDNPTAYAARVFHIKNNSLSASARGSRDVFAAAVVPRCANVSAAISRLIRMEVGERTFAATGQGARITVVGIKAIVYVSVEAPRSMKPGTRSNEGAADEPIGSVVPVGGTVVRGIVEVAIGTVWGQSDTNGDLGRIGARDDTPVGQGGRAGQSSDRVELLHGNILPIYSTRNSAPKEV
jgi:hypothetical protein